MKTSYSVIRTVVDTNVIISGLFGITGSPSTQILEAVRAQKIILVSSPVIIDEISQVIGRERIIKITQMNKAERQSFIEGLIERSDMTAGKQLASVISRDTKDDKFLACAYEAKADFIVTGDEDLLILKEFRGTKIVTPRAFVASVLHK